MAAVFILPLIMVIKIINYLIMTYHPMLKHFIEVTFAVGGIVELTVSEVFRGKKLTPPVDWAAQKKWISHLNFENPSSNKGERAFFANGGKGSE